MCLMWYQWMALAGVLISFSVLFLYFIRLVRLGKPKEYSQKRGSVGKAVAYSGTVAMLPNNKESAYMHLPTFSLGIIFHVGIFTSCLIFILSFFPCIMNWIIQYPVIRYIATLVPAIGFCSGLFLFFKRVFNKKLKHLTNIDDYLSNALATLFQLATVLLLLYTGCSSIVCAYYICATIVLLYMPVGKLRHVVYFFAARYHLGFFYGWRNVWPPAKSKK